ncbi:putative MFS-type transporter YusP [Cladorrhinum sp. PSN259]|nr:putative MFS-type transporter YusP [Cladorrhinum sp. PSN259]
MEKDTATVSADTDPAGGSPPDNDNPKDLRFWLVFAGLCLAGFLAAMDSTIIFTALPTIASDLGGQADYVWLGNAYVFASTAIQPLYGQLSNIFGRRYPMIISVLFFLLGSGIAGAAKSSAMFIAGRLVQGLGGGGTIMLIDLIVCDLLPLRERSQYLGAVLGACAVATLIGPVVGGALVSRASWRWAFWINLPISGLTLAVIVVFLRVSWTQSPSWMHALARIDYLGNTIFVGSITSILIGLVQAGVVHPWGAWQTIVPLVVGFVGWGVFFVQQAYCAEPTMPLRLFAHRTSASVSLQNFVVSMLLQWCVYVLPLYFQSQLGASALKSGLWILPINAFMIPSGAVAGAILTKLGKYKPLHWIGFGVLAISCGLFSTMSPSTKTVAWAWFQILAGIGIGFPLTTQLPAIQAVLPESDTAISTSTYSFIRSFGFVWGATIPSIIFNSRVDATVGSVDDAQVRAALANGGAYSYALQVRHLTGSVLEQTLDVYSDAMRILWLAGLGFALFGFLLVFLEKHVDMRVTLETEFGLEERPKREGDD